MRRSNAITTTSTRPERGTRAERGRRPARRLVSARGRSTLNKRKLRSDENINQIKQMYLNFKNAPVGEIASINYNLYSWEDIISKTTTNITTSNPGGTNSLNSIQMGTDIPSGTCATCHLDVKTCPGHLGRIEFKFPIVHPSKLISASVTNVMNSICESCGNTLLAPSMIEDIVGRLPADESKRLKAIADASMNAVCRTPGCWPGGNVKRNYNEGVATYYRSGPGGGIVTIEYILNVFDNISDENARLLQFNPPAHPRNLIMRGLVVIPPCARAPAIMDDGTIKNSDTTDLYRAVIEANNSLKTADRIDALARAVNDLMYKGIENVQDTNTGHFKYKINDKNNGAIRSVSQGKTIMNSGRAVIVGDPNLKFGEIGVPRVLANRMRIKETVTEESIDRLSMYLRDRKIFMIHPSSGDFVGYQLRVTAKMVDEYELQIGDVVERSLMEENLEIGQTADIIMSFRQPVLHKYSLMANTVRLRDNYTFAIHMAETTARNADFDGDEINMHAVTDVETMQELYRSMYSPRNIISAQNSMALLAAVYDALLSIYLMLRDPDHQISQLEFMRFLKKITNRRDLPTLAQRASDLGISELFTYRMAFSAILPAGLSYRKNDVIIEDGILIAGRPTKNHVGNSPDSIIQAILLQFDDMRARDFITDLYFILVEYLSNHAFTVGYKDLVATQELIDYKNEQLELLMTDVEQLNHNNQNEIEKKVSEQKIIFKINAITERLHKRCKDELSLLGNRFVTLIDSGAKGKSAELGAMVMSAGQRYSQGQRMKLQLNHGTRCLPYFKEGDNSPLARGYCSSSYFEGFTLPEFLMGQTGARDDIVTMMMGTPDAGDLSHKSVRVLENIKAQIDGTLKNPNGKIVQYVYGNDGLEPERMITVDDPISNVNTFSAIDWILDDINMKYEGTTGNEAGIPVPIEVYDEEEYVNGPDLRDVKYADRTSPPPSEPYSYTKGSFDEVSQLIPWIGDYIFDDDMANDLVSLVNDVKEVTDDTSTIYEELRTFFSSEFNRDLFDDAAVDNVVGLISADPDDILIHLGRSSSLGRSGSLKKIGEQLGLKTQNVYEISDGPMTSSMNQGYVKKRLEELVPMDTESSDIVTLLNPLGVFEDVGKSLTESHRILKKGGLMILPTLPDSDSINDLRSGFVNVVFNDFMTPSNFMRRGISIREITDFLNGFGMIEESSNDVYTVWVKPKQ